MERGKKNIRKEKKKSKESKESEKLEIWFDPILRDNIDYCL